MLITVTLNPAIDRILDVPGFRAGATLKARVVAVVPAGKGVNVSRYLWSLGVPSVAAGLIGVREGAFYEASFAGTGIRPSFLDVDAPTRVNTTILRGAGKPETHLREEGFSLPPLDWPVLAQSLLDYAGKGNTFVFSGSLPLSYTAEEFARLIGRLRRSGSEVAVDASGPALRAAIGMGVEIISPNETELREVGIPLRRLRGQVAAVALKRGPKGGALYVGRDVFRACAAVPQRLVKNTVGAGDAFLAGCLAARLRGLPPAEQIRWAVAAGAAAVVGGIVGRLDPKDFARFLAKA